MKQNLVGKILGKIKTFVQDFVTIKIGVRNFFFPKNFFDPPTQIFLKILFFMGTKYLVQKSLDLAHDFPSKILFHFLSVKMFAKKSSQIFRWPDLCPFGKILAQDFQMAAVTKILGRQEKTIAPLLSKENRKTLRTEKCTKYVRR